MRIPTTKDVALLAGISKSTVSRVLVGDPHVLPETREKVEAAIRESGFQPNLHARALRRGVQGEAGSGRGLEPLEKATVFLEPRADIRGSQQPASSGAAAQLVVEHDVIQAVDIVRLIGTLDPLNVARFEETLQTLCARGCKMVVDCSKLAKVNSVCLSFLSKYSLECSNRGGRMALCCLPPNMTTIIRLLGVYRVLEIYPAVETAVAALAGSSILA